MRVLHVIEAMHQGGAESLLVEHARRAGPGVEVLICALNRGGPALEAARVAGARVFLLEKGGARWSGLQALIALMRRERVDVVNGHNPTGGIYGLAAARWSGVPVGIRTEHSLHAPGRHSPIYPALERAGTWMADRVICVCEAVRESHVSRLGWARERFIVITNGISEAPPARPREAVRAELGFGAETPLVIAVGSLTRQKSQHVLLEAMARLQQREARLLLAGEGPLREDLERRARELALGQRVRFLGARLDVADLYAASDVYALPSQREGLSISLLESMRAGIPAVATRVGGNGEAIEDGVSGRLVPVHDPAGMAAALDALIADRAGARAMGAAAEKRWRSRFTAERMVRETEALYRERLARRAPGERRASGEAEHVA